MSSNKLQLQENNQLLDQYINRVVSAKDTVSNLPEAGGSGSGGIQYELVTIPAGATSGSVTYTLPRVTKAFGSINAYLFLSTSQEYRAAFSVRDNMLHFVSIMEPWNNTIDFETDWTPIYFTNGAITWVDMEFFFDNPVEILLVNDPNADELNKDPTLS